MWIRVKTGAAKSRRQAYLLSLTVTESQRRRKVTRMLKSYLKIFKLSKMIEVKSHLSTYARYLPPETILDAMC